MLFNLEKFKVMHMGFNNPRVDYFMDATRIHQVHEEKDLGIIVSDDLKWDKQLVCCSSWALLLGFVLSPPSLLSMSPSSITWYRPRGGCSEAGKVTACLVESNVSLPPGG